MWYPNCQLRVNVTVFSIFPLGAHLDFSSSEYRSNERLEVRDVEYGYFGSQLQERKAVWRFERPLELHVDREILKSIC